MAALVEGHDRIGDVRPDGIAGIGGLFAYGAPAAGAEMVQSGVGCRDRQPGQRFPGRHRGARERQKDFLSDVLGLIASAEHPGGHRNHSGIGGAEDLLEVRPHHPSSRRRRHGAAVLPFDTPGRAAVPVGQCPHDGGACPPLPYDVHTCTAPPAPQM
jgi:hypothetical protein